MIGSSDARSLNAVGSGVTRFLGRTAQDLRAAIETNRTIALGNAWPFFDFLSQMRLHIR